MPRILTLKLSTGRSFTVNESDAIYDHIQFRIENALYYFICRSKIQWNCWINIKNYYFIWKSKDWHWKQGIGIPKPQNSILFILLIPNIKNRKAFWNPSESKRKSLGSKFDTFTHFGSTGLTFTIILWVETFPEILSQIQGVVCFETSRFPYFYIHDPTLKISMDFPGISRILEKNFGSKLFPEIPPLYTTNM